MGIGVDKQGRRSVFFFMKTLHARKVDIKQYVAKDQKETFPLKERGQKRQGSGRSKRLVLLDESYVHAAAFPFTEIAADFFAQMPDDQDDIGDALLLQCFNLPLKDRFAGNGRHGFRNLITGNLPEAGTLPASHDDRLYHNTSLTV